LLRHSVYQAFGHIACLATEKKTACVELRCGPASRTELSCAAGEAQGARDICGLVLHMYPVLLMQVLVIQTYG